MSLLHCRIGIETLLVEMCYLELEVVDRVTREAGTLCPRTGSPVCSSTDAYRHCFREPACLGCIAVVYDI
jgi:hypothetical protein